jgi:hypothetical protein
MNVMQNTNTIFLVRPANFGFNEETAASNAFQNKKEEDAQEIKDIVLREFDSFVLKLKSKGVNVHVFEDTANPIKPDAIFPNNWISLHEDGTLVLYPMQAKNRQLERREDIIDKLKLEFDIKNTIDYSIYEKENRFLEGTGSIVFDHVNKIAYACISPRTDKDLFEQLCATINYKPISFQALDKNKQEIYHTNVMLCVGEKVVVICLESIQNPKEQERVIRSFEKTGHQIVAISFAQMNHFAGNMLELITSEEKSILVLSQTAYSSLSKFQIEQIENHTELFPIPIKTIETIGGGSARCMMAEIFSSKKNK